MRHLLACTCLTPALLAFAGTAQAERVINSDITTPVRTSTATNGSPDDIEVTDDGSIVLGSGTAITIDSNNDVENDGEIEIEDASDATGILAQPGRTGNITNSGTISIIEDYTAEDDDDDDDLDGPFATVRRNHGIRIAPGGTFTGNVANSGAITVEGNDSAAIALDSALAGSLSHSGAITVLGDDSEGIRAGNVSGDVTINGTIGVRGKNSVAVALGGDIGGALVFQGTITTTGYRTTTVPADTDDLDADDLLQGGSAVIIGGDVDGGIHLAAPPPDLDEDEDDEDDDGVDDAEEGTANITAYGKAPAMRIGAADRAVTIGAVEGADGGHGLVIDGLIAGHGLYEGVDGNGLVIGGLGGDVTIVGGMTVNGVVSASANDASATAIRIGAGATVAEIEINGAVSAEAGTGRGLTGTAIRIEDGANVSTIRNTGTIVAGAGKDAVATAIVDRSGGVGLVENSGLIRATGEPGSAIAIDLRANGSGAIVRQLEAEEDADAPRIAGDLLFGAGDDLLDVADGTIAGTTRFGAGDDRLVLAGDAAYTGAVEFGAGSNAMTLTGTSAFGGSADFGGVSGTLMIGDDARFEGSLAGSTGLAVTVDGGRFAVTGTGRVDLASLAVSDGGAIGISIDAAGNASTLFDVAGEASFGEGSELQVRLNSIGGSEGRYVFLEAGSISGADNLEFDDSTLPFLFGGTVEAEEGGELAVTISRKTAQQLGLNDSSSRAYDAIFAALDADAEIGSVFLAIEDAETVQAQFAQMLPDHAGGVFETVTLGSRATARFLADPRAPLADLGAGWGFWLQQVGWGTSKDLGDTASYDVTGWGASGGAERSVGDIGSFGASVAYLNGRDADGENDNEVRSEQFELAGYWRGQWGGLRAHARASAAMIDFSGKRFFEGVGLDGDTVTRTTRGSWNGELYSLAAGLSYEMRFGRMTLRPAAAIDYYRLSEDGYTEEGGGESFDLIVESRTSDELAAAATLTLGYDFGSLTREGTWFRTEIEGGRRQILGGELGATTARFGDGDPFTLLPEDRTDGWTGSLRAVGGNGATQIGAEVHAEEQNGRASVALRLSVGIGF
ncbi:autotransporter domain-containing protein [Sphingosinicella sp. CPCC 101087]|uniref:autotransporter outer membrane beta-barrel domain-containing protein n=1 Tax=Sphingosinicella sp. CPCC 101087 TaxID=2497754 RepID=UPI00101E177B|nr:autotransporter outer membrane beta-barrel domain-containing protein [Sphingosinicella sp. CPCC 101087]